MEAAGIQERSGLLKLESRRTGIYIAAVETETKLIILEADDFNNYLISDGLAHIYRLRRTEGILEKPGRERYSNSPKAIVQVGTDGGGDACRVLGLPLEIVPLQNPFELRERQTLHVRVLFRNEPLAQAYLGWDIPDGGEAPLGTVRNRQSRRGIGPYCTIRSNDHSTHSHDGDQGG